MSGTTRQNMTKVAVATNVHLLKYLNIRTLQQTTQDRQRTSICFQIETDPVLHTHLMKSVVYRIN